MTFLFMISEDDIKRRMVEFGQQNKKYYSSYIGTVGGVQVTDYGGSPFFTSKAKLTNTIKDRMRTNDLINLMKDKLITEGVIFTEDEIKYHYRLLTNPSIQKKFNALYKELVKAGVIVIKEV